MNFVILGKISFFISLLFHPNFETLGETHAFFKLFTEKKF